MSRMLLLVEITAVIAAAVLGVLWVISPNEPYEPIAFLLLLIGTSVVELVRRYVLPQVVSDGETAKTRVREILNGEAGVRSVRALDDTDGKTEARIRFL